MNEIDTMNFNQNFNPNMNNMTQFPNFNNLPNYTSTINNNCNYNFMQFPCNNMMMNNMFNNNCFPNMNFCGNMPLYQNFGGCSFQNQMPNNFNMMNNNMNNFQNSMNNIQFINNQIINNMNNNTINFNNYFNNSMNNMNNMQTSFNMNNPMENMNLNNNQNMMNNNLYNSMNMNNFNSPSNNLNLINNNSKNSLSNSFNNLSTTKFSEDFYLGQNMDDIYVNTAKTIKPFQNETINMIFRFRTGETFNMLGKMNEKLSNVIAEFKNTQCPKDKNEFLFFLHNGSKLNIEKTLRESKINNGDIILIINNDSQRKEIKEEKKLNSEINSSANISPSGIIVKEHIHNLVYCLNNFIWKCNLCSIKYQKISPKYFCSVCNFSMCEKCHAARNYPKKKAFPENIDTSHITIKKKFLKTVYHKHILVYSRTSRDSTELKQWFCNNCKETFENEDWSFYCTKCDYDLCKKCAGFT